MDINILRSLITVLSLVAFLGIVFWAWSAKRKTAFDEAAQLPFADDDVPARQPETGPRP
jgi:cytochrome c oxidase cbb3-type subunit 4